MYRFFKIVGKFENVVTGFKISEIVSRPLSSQLTRPNGATNGGNWTPFLSQPILCFCWEANSILTSRRHQILRKGDQCRIRYPEADGGTMMFSGRASPVLQRQWKLAMDGLKHTKSSSQWTSLGS